MIGLRNEDVARLLHKIASRVATMAPLYQVSKFSGRLVDILCVLLNKWLTKYSVIFATHVGNQLGLLVYVYQTCILDLLTILVKFTNYFTQCMHEIF